jgi:hypothetical protein
MYIYWFIFGENIMWSTDPMLGGDFEKNNQASRCYAIGG